MPAPPRHPNPPKSTPLAVRRLDNAQVQAYRAALHDIIGMTTALAQRIHAEIMALPTTSRAEPASSGSPPAGTNSRIALAAAFDDAARTVRECIMLAHAVAEPQPGRTLKLARQTDPVRHRAAANRRAVREIEDSLQDDVERPETLNDESEPNERPEPLDVGREINTRPAQAIIAGIMHDLGVKTVPTAHPFRSPTPEVIELRIWAADPPKAAKPRLVCGPVTQPSPNIAAFPVKRIARPRHPTKPGPIRNG